MAYCQAFQMAYCQSLLEESLPPAVSLPEPCYHDAFYCSISKGSLSADHNGHSKGPLSTHCLNSPLLLTNMSTLAVIGGELEVALGTRSFEGPWGGAPYDFPWLISLLLPPWLRERGKECDARKGETGGEGCSKAPQYLYFQYFWCS